MKSWLYVTAVSGTDANGEPTILFEHCVVMARDVDEACQKGWRQFCKAEPQLPFPAGFTRTHRAEYAVQLVAQ